MGVETVAGANSATVAVSAIAEEVAHDVTASLMGSLLSPTPEGGRDDSDVVATLRAQIEQLEAELASSKNDIEFANLKEQELENRHALARKEIAELKAEVDSVNKQLRSSTEEHQATKSLLTSEVTERSQLEETLSKSRADLTISQGEAQNLRAEIEAELAAKRRECEELQARVHELEGEVGQNLRQELPPAIAAPTNTATGQEKMNLPEGHPESGLLAAAYQQISVLNTQLAHLYAELTLARTETQNLRSQLLEESGARSEKEAPGASQTAAESQKQGQHIADLVSDIRHLQLDLEYHQQKLDQMIEEKQQMMKSLKSTERELHEAKQQLEERDQMLKHRDVDLQQLRQELRSPRQLPEAAEESALVALRSEAAAKDSALIVSHYELHKEKLMRDRLEKKNLKLMERMQKLMMVVETMRKDNITLERSLAAKERAHDEKELQLRQVTQKARQLQKLAKASKAGPTKTTSANSGARAVVLDLEVPSSQQGLPPLSSRRSRSVDSGDGRRSGRSTPRTPRAPPSPYGSRGVVT